MLLMLIMVTMGILYTVVSRTSAVGMKWARTQGGSAAMKEAKEALIGYAATYRDDSNHSNEVFGYLPCPDQTATATTTFPYRGNGLAEASCDGQDVTSVGLLPYKALGLEDLRDSAGVCLWYVVSGTFKNNLKSAAPMNWDMQGQIKVLDSSGLDDTAHTIASPDDANGGAAAVIIATGPPLSGQNRTSNNGNDCGALPAEVAKYIESTISGSANGVTTLTQGTADSATNNDQILVITPKEIFGRIIARADFKNPLTSTPVGQINNLSNKIKIAIEKQLQDDLLASGVPTGVAQPGSQAGYSQNNSSKLIGDLAETLALSSTSDNNWLSNWNDQYRYVVCSDLTPCLSVSGTNCRGALMFAGQSVTGGPRTSGQKPPATLPAPPNAYLANYFEPGSGLEILDSASTIFSGNTAYTDANNLVTNRSADVGTCLFPGSFVSFAKNIGGSGVNFYTPPPSGDPAASIQTATSTITLGNTAAGADVSGCVWFPTPLALTSSLRAYFRFQITDRGEGFVFALADAAQNNPTNTSPVMCGDTGNALGYSGSGIVAPKIGLEIDTRRSSTTRNDPGTSTKPDHLAFLYWGTALSTTDDNTHGVPSASSISGSQPLNPRTLLASTVQSASWSSNTVTVTTASAHYLIPNQTITIAGITPAAYNGDFQIDLINDTSFTYTLGVNPGSYSSGGTASSPFYGVSTVKSSDPHLPYDGVLPTNIDIHVRLDITKNYTVPTGTYTLKAYAASAFDSCTSLNNMQNLALDMEDQSCAPATTIEQDGIVIDNISGFGEAMANVYVGFTNGQRQNFIGSGEQNIVIYDLMLRSQ